MHNDIIVSSEKILWKIRTLIYLTCFLYCLAALALKQYLYKTWSKKKNELCTNPSTSSYRYYLKKESHVKILNALQLLPCVTENFL